MRSRTPLQLLPLAIALAMVACGGGTPTTTTPTPTRTLSKVAGDNQTAATGAAVAVAPSVRILDENSQPVSGVAITFSVASGGGSVTGAAVNTGSDGTAAVGSWTLGPAAGTNTLTATAAGTGVINNPATFSATAQLPQAPSFQPTTNTSLNGGTYTYASVTIPAGVTVTLTGNVTINVTGAFTLAGVLSGNCVGISVNATGLLTLSGSISNTCATIPASGGPAISLVGLGGYTVSNGSTASSGPVTITNDPTLQNTDFGALRAPAAPRHGAALSSGPPCQFVAGTFPAVPATAPNGVDGTTATPATPGQSGSLWAGSCRGDMTVVGAFVVTGQSGGTGGDGNSTAANATTVGANGGNGGDVTLQATGNIEFSTGSSTTLRSGSGGNGGFATASASAFGGSASATAGNGGAPGLIEVRAKGSIFIDAPLTLDIGHAGSGGRSIALAGDGNDGATACPAQIGGAAEATGGEGGSTPDRILVGANVTGLSQVTVTGGSAGRGGDASAQAGDGGDGASACPPGASGGAQEVTGGDGGDALLKDQNGALLDVGANGGGATFSGGQGGAGWNGCPAGHDGGPGGNAGVPTGVSGLAGTGIGGHGTNGGVTFDGVGNGGNGGNGVNPGTAGAAADASAIAARSAPFTSAPSFVAGTPGAHCAMILVNTVTAYSNQVQETVTQTNQSDIQVTITATFPVYTGNITLTPGANDPGVTFSIAAPQVVTAGTPTTAFIDVDNAAIGDHIVTFTASATIAGVPVTGQGSFTVHVFGGARYAVTIAKVSDPDDVESVIELDDVHEIGILEEMIGTTPKITVYGLMVAHIPVSFVRSGTDAFDAMGNFLATALFQVGVPGHGNQPAAYSIQGKISAGSITFTIQVDPTVAATFPFHEVTYTGSGPSKP